MPEKVSLDDVTLGVELDWAIAQFTGASAHFEKGQLILGDTRWCWRLYQPSSDWSISGPEIERYKVLITPTSDGWSAECRNCTASGSTALDAAWRAILKAHHVTTVLLPDFIST